MHAPRCKAREPSPRRVLHLEILAVEPIVLEGQRSKAQPILAVEIVELCTPVTRKQPVVLLGDIRRKACLVWGSALLILEFHPRVFATRLDCRAHAVGTRDEPISHGEPDVRAHVPQRHVERGDLAK